MTPAQRKVVAFLIDRNAPVAVQELLAIPGGFPLVRSVVEKGWAKRVIGEPTLTPLSVVQVTATGAYAYRATTKREVEVVVREVSPKATGVPRQIVKEVRELVYELACGHVVSKRVRHRRICYCEECAQLSAEDELRSIRYMAIGALLGPPLFVFGLLLWLRWCGQ